MSTEQQQPDDGDQDGANTEHGHDDGQPDDGDQDGANTEHGHDDGQPDDGDQDDDDRDTFPRAYVERLRSKAADYRTNAKTLRADVDTLRSELWAERVAASGRLADPSDLPIPDDTDADADTVSAAIDELLQRKPHLAARRAGGDIGQHTRRDDTAAEVSIAGMLQRGA